MKRKVWILLISFVFVFFACGAEEGDDPKLCPRFLSYQIYPMVGTGDTEYELLVALKNKSENNGVNKIEAKVYNSDGSPTQISFDMVQSNADTFRFLRAFKGSEVCDEGTCKLFFRVVASHESGCLKLFKSDVFVVEMPIAANDDDDNGDDDDTADDDDDTADDDDDDDDDDNDDATDDDDATA